MSNRKHTTGEQQGAKPKRRPRIPPPIKPLRTELPEEISRGINASRKAIADLQDELGCSHETAFQVAMREERFRRGMAQNSDKTAQGAEKKPQKPAKLFARTNDGTPKVDTEKVLQDVVANVEEWSNSKLERGRWCAQIVDEVKRFRYLRLDAVKALSEIQTEQPNFLIWKLRENLNAEDRELFDHPNRWEARPALYAYGLLAKEYSKHWTTIRDWVKAWNRWQRQRSRAK